MLPYSSNLLGVTTTSCLTETVQEAVREHIGSTPPSSTVAVIVLPPTPVVSTVIAEVPWPLEIVPAETDQLYVRLIEPASPTEAVKVAGWPASTSLGQLTETVGHGGLQSVHTATVTVVVAFAVC